jgi:hypothetical protein
MSLEGKYIKVHIACYGEQDMDIPEDLRETLAQGETEDYRFGMVFLEHVFAIYPHNSGDTIIEVWNESFRVRESVEDIEGLIAEVLNK